MKGKKMNQYIQTDYILHIEFDGFILNPKAWIICITAVSLFYPEKEKYEHLNIVLKYLDKPPKKNLRFEYGSLCSDGRYDMCKQGIKNAFIESIGAHNVATLTEMSELHLYDFGIFIELTPDEEEKAMLENAYNILNEVDLIYLLIDCKKSINDLDVNFLKNIKI